VRVHGARGAIAVRRSGAAAVVRGPETSVALGAAALAWPVHPMIRVTPTFSRPPMTRLRIVLLLGALSISLPSAARDVALVVTNATIVTMAEGTTAPFVGWMAVGADGRIDGLGAGAPPADLQAERTLDATDRIVLPGFVSAHSHLWSAPFRGIATESTLYDWIAAAHTPFSPYYRRGDFETFTTYGVLDFLSHGITTAYNWVSNNGYAYGHWMEQFEAELAAPQRFVFGWALDTTRSEAVNRQRLEAFLEMTRPLMDEHDHLLGISLSALGLLRGDTKFPFWEGQWMRDYDLDAQAHYLEAAEIAPMQHRQFAILEDAGMIDERLHFAHFIHTTDHILQRAVDAGVRMVWNPLSNGRLASGLADIPKYLNAGLAIGMGLDGQASGDHSDPFENMRMGLYATRMQYRSAAVMTPYQILAMHTLGSARMLGVDDRVGSLEPGKFADFLVMDPTEPDAGPIFDLYATIVTVLSTRNLEGVFVGGEAVYVDGAFVDPIWARVPEETRRRVGRMVADLEADGGRVPEPTYRTHHHQP